MCQWTILNYLWHQITIDNWLWHHKLSRFSHLTLPIYSHGRQQRVFHPPLPKFIKRQIQTFALPRDWKKMPTLITNQSRKALPCPPPLKKKKVQTPKDQFLSTGLSALPSLLCLLWLDPCCLDTVHTAVRLGHSQASKESGVNGTRKWLVVFPQTYIQFLGITLKKMSAAKSVSFLFSKAFCS